MCFSVEVEKEMKKNAQRFNAQVSMADVEHFLTLRARGENNEWTKTVLNLSRRPTSNIFKLPDEDGRIYPGSFTYVMVMENKKRVFKPMRYRIRPSGSVTEIPSKFNVFNARLDSLENRQTWQPLFMRNHGLLPFVRFFEWVEKDSQKRLISFHSDRHEIMWAPCLWDYWENEKEGVGFYSFAIITDEPPREVWEMGHDRCPIFLREDLIDHWLSPEGKNQSEIYRILKNKQEVSYLHAWSA
ncbi:MAG: SOS response-associated peptidase family protein [Bacteriovoracia bacterium]